jgi:hypothetical protein
MKSTWPWGLIRATSRLCGPPGPERDRFRLTLISVNDAATPWTATGAAKYPATALPLTCWNTVDPVKVSRVSSLPLPFRSR